MKRALSLILVAMMLMSMVACGGNNNADTNTGKTNTGTSDTGKTDTGKTDGGKKEDPKPAEPTYAEEITIAATVGSLDPNLLWGLESELYQAMVYETLIVRNDETGEISMQLAESVEWANEECSKIHVVLRDDIFFSNGEPVTAEDVAFSMDRTVYGSVATYYDSSEVINDKELYLNLVGPCSVFMPVLAITPCGIVNKAAAEADPNGQGLIGTGPWAYEMDSYVAENSISLVRNENYWGEFDSPTKKVNFVKISEASARAIALQTGDINFAKDLQATELPLLEGDSKLTVERFPATNFIIMWCNDRLESDKLTEEEKNLRRAVACAINKQDIMIGTGNENGQVMTSMWPFVDVAYIADESDYENDLSYNPEKAKEYLAKAGGKTELLVWVSTTEPGALTAGQIIQEQCRQVGITINLEEVDGNTFTSAVRSGTIPEYDMAIGRNSFNYDIVNFSHYSSGSINRSFNNAAASLEAMNIINNSSDDATRNEQIKVMQTTLHENVSVIPLYFRELNCAYTAGLEGVQHNAVPWYDFTNIALRTN